MNTREKYLYMCNKVFYYEITKKALLVLAVILLFNHCRLYAGSFHINWADQTIIRVIGVEVEGSPDSVTRSCAMSRVLAKTDENEHIIYEMLFEGTCFSLEDMISDHYGNTYVSITFSNRLWIGGQRFNAIGQQDGLIVAFDQEGSLLWFFHAGGFKDIAIEKIRLEGEILAIAGTFDGTAVFENTVLVTNRKTTFAGRLDRDGYLLNIKSLFREQHDLGYRLLLRPGPEAMTETVDTPDDPDGSGESSQDDDPEEDGAMVVRYTAHEPRDD